MQDPNQILEDYKLPKVKNRRFHSLHFEPFHQKYKIASRAILLKNPTFNNILTIHTIN